MYKKRSLIRLSVSNRQSQSRARTIRDLLYFVSFIPWYISREGNSHVYVLPMYLLLFSTLYNIFTSSCAHLKIILSPSSCHSCHSILPLPIPILQSVLRKQQYNWSCIYFNYLYIYIYIKQVKTLTVNYPADAPFPHSDKTH
jgi:hypothetical protein